MFYKGLSSFADQVDATIMFLIVVSVILMAGITLFTLYCVVRYSKKNNPNPTDIEGHLGLELTWTIIPTIIVLVMFYVGWETFLVMREVPGQLFSMEPEYVKDFENADSETALNNIKQIFNYHRKELSDDVVVTNLAAKNKEEEAQRLKNEKHLQGWLKDKKHRQKWLVEDKKNNKKYHVINEGKNLFAYDTSAKTITVKVTGQMWSWFYTYENGKDSDILYIPENRPVKILLRSKDVLHSFYVPEFRTKEDAVPGMNNYMWFQSPKANKRPDPPTYPKGHKKEGQEIDWGYRVFCAEYCGDRHSKMLSWVRVLPQEEFDKWYNAPPTPAELGKIVFNAKGGCIACHATVPGEKSVGPSLEGIFGRTSVVLSDGDSKNITVDEEYIKKSLLTPQADIVVGYGPPTAPMPSQKGNLSDDEIKFLIEYLKNLK